MEDADFGGMVDGLFKFVLDFLARSAVEFADDVDGDEREEESRYDFIEAEPGELFPDEDGQAADDDAGQGAVLGHVLPVQGQEDGRAEGGTEASPGIGDHGQDVTVRVEGQDDGQGGDDEDRQAADVDQLFIAGVLADEGVVKVLGNGRCRDQELGRSGTHDSSQDGGQDEARCKGREELAAHDQEDFFRIGAD